jgi:hypothetical protein
MHCSKKITKLRSHQNELYQELSDLELEVIAGGLNPQPLPPGLIARQFIARQPE